MGSPCAWYVLLSSSLAFLLYHCCLPNIVYLMIFVVLDCLELEDQHRDRIRAAFAFAREIENFDDLVDPRYLFDCCLGPEPSKYVLEKIHQEEKSKFILLTLEINLSLLVFLPFCIVTHPPLLVSRDVHQV